MPHINLSAVCYTRCNSHRPFGSISSRHSHWRLYWYCTGRSRCACELCRRIRSCTSARRPLGRPRFPGLSAPLRGLPQELSQQERLSHWSRIEFCENHSSSVRLGCQRFLPLGTWRCTPSWLALQPVAYREQAIQQQGQQQRWQSYGLAFDVLRGTTPKSHVVLTAVAPNY